MFDDGMARRTGVLGGPGKQRKGLVGGMLSFDTRRARARLLYIQYISRRARWTRPRGRE